MENGGGLKAIDRKALNVAMLRTWCSAETKIGGAEVAEVLSGVPQKPWQARMDPWFDQACLQQFSVSLDIVCALH